MYRRRESAERSGRRTVRVSLEFLDSDCFNFAFTLIRSSIYTFDAYEFVISPPVKSPSLHVKRRNAELWQQRQLGTGVGEMLGLPTAGRRAGAGGGSARSAPAERTAS